MIPKHTQYMYVVALKNAAIATRLEKCHNYNYALQLHCTSVGRRGGHDIYVHAVIYYPKECSNMPLVYYPTFLVLTTTHVIVSDNKTWGARNVHSSCV